MFVRVNTSAGHRESRTPPGKVREISKAITGPIRIQGESAVKRSPENAFQMFNCSSLPYKCDPLCCVQLTHDKHMT